MGMSGLVLSVSRVTSELTIDTITVDMRETGPRDSLLPRQLQSRDCDERYASEGTLTGSIEEWVADVNRNRPLLPTQDAMSNRSTEGEERVSSCCSEEEISDSLRRSLSIGGQSKDSFFTAVSRMESLGEANILSPGCRACRCHTCVSCALRFQHELETASGRGGCSTFLSDDSHLTLLERTPFLLQPVYLRRGPRKRGSQLKRYSIPVPTLNAADSPESGKDKRHSTQMCVTPTRQESDEPRYRSTLLVTINPPASCL